MTALFIHVAYRIGSCRQQIHLMLFKADGLVEKQTVEGFIMQIFSHIEVQLLLNDNNVCYVVNHVYVGGWASNKIKWYFPMNYHAWVHCELGKLFFDCCVQQRLCVYDGISPRRTNHVFVYCTLNTFGYRDTNLVIEIKNLYWLNSFKSVYSFFCSLVNLKIILNCRIWKQVRRPFAQHNCTLCSSIMMSFHY